jgi:hypothetical protein
MERKKTEYEKESEKNIEENGKYLARINMELFVEHFSCNHLDSIIYKRKMACRLLDLVKDFLKKEEK